MKQIVILMILIGVGSKSFCQTEEIRITTLNGTVKNQSGVSKLQSITDVNEAKKLAFIDIENKTPFLITDGGIAPTISIDKINFEEKYHVYFYETGCAMLNKEIGAAYNFVVLDFVLKKYGKDAISKISKDVFALDDWKKQN